jgi:hypothetical protein
MTESFPLISCRFFLFDGLFFPRNPGISTMVQTSQKEYHCHYFHFQTNQQSIEVSQVHSQA